MPFPFRRHRRSATTAPDPDLRLIVGLGNPGSKFAGTRHNVGFMVAGRLAELNDIAVKGSKHRAEVGRGVVAGKPAIVALPLTYMNESGNAVQRLLAYYHVPVERLLVIADDIDLPFGTLRLRPGGSSGGQGGLRSIEQAIGTSEFPRLRFGIGRPVNDAVDHVLSRFPSVQQAVLPQLIDKAAQAVTATVGEDIGAAMNEYNRNWLCET